MPLNIRRSPGEVVRFIPTQFLNIEYQQLKSTGSGASNMILEFHCLSAMESTSKEEDSGDKK